MSKLAIFTGEKQAIPSELKEQLPALFQEEQLEASRLPASRIEIYQKSLQLDPPITVKQVWSVAHHEGKVIGYGEISWNIKGSNLNRANFFTFIEPAERLKGYGTLLSKELLQFIPSQITILDSFCFEHTPGPNYLKLKFNGKEVYDSSISLSKIREVFDQKEVAKEAYRLKEQANKNGYDLFFVDHEKFEEQLNFPEFVKMAEILENDMPIGELSSEYQVITEEDYRESLERGTKVGLMNLTIVAKHSETGKLVGFSQGRIIPKDNPLRCWQDDTGVLREHRGSKLGLTLKYQLLQKLLEETEVAYWTTSNEVTNVHMLKINQLLKHEEWINQKGYEITREEWEKFLH